MRIASKCLRPGVLGVMLVACVACEPGKDVERDPVATSVQPEEIGSAMADKLKRAEARDSPLLPGSGLVPTFESSPTSTVPVWRWVYDADNGSNTGIAQDSAVGAVGGVTYTCTFLSKKSGVTCSTARKDVGSTAVSEWEAAFDEEPFVGAGQMIVHDGALYVSHHSYISTGAELSAYALGAGNLMWRVKLDGIGPASHSKYRNETFLEFDRMTRSVLVFGKESHGGYVERRDARTGKLLAHKVIPSWAINQEPDRGGSEALRAASGSYEDRSSSKFPAGKERTIRSWDEEPLALHVWPESRVMVKQKF